MAIDDLENKISVLMNDGKKRTTNQVINEITGQCCADSHHELYRRVLRILNRHVARDFLCATQQNRYMPIKWYAADYQRIPW